MIFMVWMLLAIFIPFFATGPEMLAAGEALCGIPWGVFQVSSSWSTTIESRRLRKADIIHYIRLRGGPDCSSTIRDSLRMYVLGNGQRHCLGRCQSDFNPND